jgi:hypothetical protein
MQTGLLSRDERKLHIAAAVCTDHVAQVSLHLPGARSSMM